MLGNWRQSEIYGVFNNNNNNITVPSGRGDIPSFIPAKLVLDLATRGDAKLSELTSACCLDDTIRI